MQISKWSRNSRGSGSVSDEWIRISQDSWTLENLSKEWTKSDFIFLWQTIDCFSIRSISMKLQKLIISNFVFWTMTRLSWGKGWSGNTNFKKFKKQSQTKCTTKTKNNQIYPRRTLISLRIETCTNLYPQCRPSHSSKNTWTRRMSSMLSFKV